MNFINIALPGGNHPGLRGWSRFTVLPALLLVLVGLIGPATEPALAGPPPAPAAQASSIVSLSVVSARTEANHPGGPVTIGDPITEYKYLINIDNTGNPFQNRNDGCHPDNPGYPDSCDWPSIRTVPGAAPIVVQGNQDDFNGVNGSGINLPPGKYLISVIAADYKLDGKHFTVPGNGSPVNVEVGMHPHPLPAATMRIKVFEDISPVNGQMDAPAEGGLAGFHAVINDIAGEISTDIFGNPLCTTYDAAGNVTGKTDCLYSDANGDIVVPNLGPIRYDVLVIPPDGTDWVETTTLEGSPSWDTWLAEGGTGLDNEFVVAGEPFPWTIFGFTRPMNNLAGGSGGVKGTMVSASVYLPQTGALPYYGDIWNGFTGTKVNGPITDGWVALSDLQNGDTAVYVGRANADGTFQISGVPDGNYLFTWWDNNLHYILDWIQVTVSNGQMYDMGTPMLTGWFTIFDGYVYDDLNQNGVKDPGEPGLSNYALVYRDRDNSEIDRMSIAVTTDSTGYYIFEKAYPMNSWMVLEAYNDRYYTTGITYQVENQPNPTTFLGGGVDVGVLPILGQRARVDWGVRPYDPTGASNRPRNGGIAGSVFYDTTRAEYDARYQGAEAWAPGIPNLTMNLYSAVPCGTNPGAPCDERGDYELAADGSFKKGQLLNTTTTETWEQPTGCTALDANGDLLTYGEDQQLFANPGPVGYRCLEAPVVGTQVQNDFATLDGNWGFGDGCFGPGGALEEGVCADGSAPLPLPADDYLVEVEIPTDILGRPIYQVVREEDINVFNGDLFEQVNVAIPPSACAGALHTVDVAGTVDANSNPTDNYAPFAYNTGHGIINVPASSPVDNPYFAAEDGGGPFEGTIRPLCDTKFVTVSNGRSIAPTFTLFTDVPIPGKWKGLIIDDLTVSTNPLDVWFGEKPGIPNSPIGVYDFSNRLLTTMTSDANGAYEVLLPSNQTVNAPTPSGLFAGMYYILGNDPGQPGAPNANYNPQFRTIGATFEVYPGLMVPSDLAPTQIVPGVLAGGSQFGLPPQCTLNDPANPDIPELFAVSRPYANTGGSFTIRGQGFGAVGANSQVTLDGTMVLSATAWSETQIDVTVPATTTVGPHQLEITANNGNTTVNGLTFHVLGSGYNPSVFEVGPGKAYATVQAGIDAAANSNGLVVIYPDTPTQWNPTGAYYENVAVYSPVKLQGIGPGGVYANNTAVLGSVLDGRGVAGDTAYAGTWRNMILGLTWDGTQAVYEGPVVYVLAENGEFTDGFKASIDGLRIQGGDQQGFPNNLAPADPGQKEFAAVQGGGIFANSYASYLQITNNIMESNGGAYASAIRLGTPNLPGNFNDNQNDFVTIANNRILANGGTNLAGAIGIFSGAEGYEVAHNDICGNYSAEYGGGISHYGYSPDGKIHDNRIYFNRSYDEGGGIMIAGELPADPAILSPGAGPVDIYNNLIQNNLANDDGGGLRFLMANAFEYNVYNNIIVNNISTHEGGGVSLNDTPNVRFFNNTVMKNITTATAMTSNGQPAPSGLSTSANSALLQATLPGGSSSFSNPLLFNNIFWDNRAGSFSGATVAGIGLPGDPGGVNHWDLGVADGTGLLSPTTTLMQVTTGTNSDASNIVNQDPMVVATYDTSVQVAPWRGNPRFVDIMMVTTESTPNLLGDYHLQDLSPAKDQGVYIQNLVKTPKFDIDNDLRPLSLENPADLGADETAGPLPPTILLHFSTAGGGNANPVPGVPAPYDDADIYTWDGEFFGREFDPSQVFASWPNNANIDGLMVDTNNDLTPPTFYLSFSANGNTNLPGLNGVQDEDVVKLSYNSTTSSYTFSLYFDGTLCGLSSNNNQDIDALDVHPATGMLYFSTLGNATVNATTGTPLGGPYHQSNIYSWNGTSCARVFDATATALISTVGNANIDGLTYIDADTFYASFANNEEPNLVDALAGPIQDEDIVLYDAGIWLLHFDGTAKGLDVSDGQDIDAISVPAGVPMIVGQRALLPGAASGGIYLPIIIKAP